MDSSVVVAVVSGVCTLLGSMLGVVTSSKLTQYRIKQLEDKVNKHNNVVERMYIAEGNILELQHDIKDLKAYHKPNWKENE